MGARDWTSDSGSCEADRRLRARIERELPSLLALARRLTREERDAEDAVQDALESAWQARMELRDPGAAGGWLRRILVRRVVDAHRRRADLPAGAPDELEGVMPDESPGMLCRRRSSAPRRGGEPRAMLRAWESSSRSVVIPHGAVILPA